MPKLPVISGEELVKALEKFGFRQVRQRGVMSAWKKGRKELWYHFMRN